MSSKKGTFFRSRLFRETQWKQALARNEWRLDETMAICTNALNSSHLEPPSFSEMIFLKSMHVAAECVQFSFNNTMYQQIYGIAAGSHLAATMAKIFVGLQAEKQFEITKKPHYYAHGMLMAHLLCSPLRQRADDFFFVTVFLWRDVAKKTKSFSKSQYILYLKSF